MDQQIPEALKQGHVISRRMAARVTLVSTAVNLYYQWHPDGMRQQEVDALQNVVASLPR